MSDCKEISIDKIYNAVQKYKAWCKKNGYNPEFITYGFKGDELIFDD